MMIFYAVLGITAIMSLYSFILMARDKQLAQKRGWRISEAHLLGAAFCMGGIGAWAGMKIFRHKTKHMKFQLLLPLFTLLQLALLIWVYINIT